jgi:hypothetical protein
MGPTERTRWQLDVPPSAETVLDALVDFSPRREVIWKETSDPTVHRIHAVGNSWAEVTEGVSYAWSREYSISGQPGGGTHIVCERYRIYRGVRGRILGTFMVLFGPRVLGSQFQVAIQRVGRAGGRSHPG